jgi:hypothetical protein
LIAESFSGPIAASLTRDANNHMKGIVFVVTFLSPPSKWLLAIARHLPLQHFMKLPLTKYLIRFLFLGPRASDELVTEFKRVLNSVPVDTLRARFATMASLNFNLPVVQLTQLA